MQNARNHVLSTSSTLKWILTRPDTICIPNDTPGRPQKRAENLSYGTLSGQRYTLQSPKLSGGLWAFSAPGVFEATHSRFLAFLCRKDDGREGISSVELAHAGRRESLLALVWLGQLGICMDASWGAGLKGTPPSLKGYNRNHRDRAFKKFFARAAVREPLSGN